MSVNLFGPARRPRYTMELPARCDRCGYDILFNQQRGRGQVEHEGELYFVVDPPIYVHHPRCPRPFVPPHPLLEERRR